MDVRIYSVNANGQMGNVRRHKKAKPARNANTSSPDVC